MEFLGTFWRSFWSPQAYKNALTWRWKILGYFLLLSLFVAIISSIAMRPYLKNFFDGEVKTALSDMASFEFVDGKVKTSGGENYAYELDSGMGFLSISETQNPSPKEYMINIEGDEISILGTVLSIEEFLLAFGLDDNAKIDKALIYSFIDRVFASYYPVAIIILFVSAAISNAFFVIILSLASFTMLMNSPLRATLGYFSSLKLSVLAITPMVFLQSIGAFFSLNDNAGFLYGLISIILVWYIIKKLPAYFAEDSQI